MKHFSKILSVCIWVGLIAYACHEWKDRPDSEEPQPLTIKEAKAWYENTQPAVVLFGQKDTSNLKSASHGKKVVTRSYWNMAKVMKNDLFSVVEIPVYSNRMIFLVRGSTQPDNTDEHPGISRLVIRRNLTTGVTDAFVVTFTGDSAYLSQPNFKKNLFRNRFLKRKSDFNGTEVITSLEGKFLRGYILENGERVKRFGMPDSENEGQFTTKSYYLCGYQDIGYYVWECHDEYDDDVDPEFPDAMPGIVVICDHIWHPVIVLEYCYIDDGYCYDECACYGIGCGSGGGNGGNNGNGNTPTLTVDPLYQAGGSNLSPIQKVKLDGAMIQFKDKYPVYTQIYNDLVSKEFKMKFRIDPSIKHDAVFGTDASIRFKSESQIKCDNLAEELIHAIQYNEYGSDMTATVRNYEFEAKVFQDLACVKYDGFCPYIASIEQSETFEYDYQQWIIDISESERSFNSSDEAKYQNFCSQWTGDQDDEGNIKPYDNLITPEMLKLYF